MGDLPTIESLIDLIGELGREVHYLLDDCEESGPVGDSIFTVEQDGVEKVSSVLDRIDELPFEEPGCILGPGAMLQAAFEQTISAREADLRAEVERLKEDRAALIVGRDMLGNFWAKEEEEAGRLRALLDEAREALMSTRLLLAEHEPHPLPVLGRVLAVLAKIGEPT